MKSMLHLAYLIFPSDFALSSLLFAFLPFGPTKFTQFSEALMPNNIQGLLNQMFAIFVLPIIFTNIVQQAG